MTDSSPPRENIDTAWITTGDGAVWSAESPSRETSPDLPSAVTKLVVGIYEQRGFDAWRLLRQRIFTTAQENVFDQEIVRVAAKRITFGASSSETPSDRSAFVDLSATSVGDPVAQRDGREFFRWEGDTSQVDREALAAVAAMAGTIPLAPERFASPRPVAALIVSASGQVLGAAVNNNAVVRCRHAEFNLVHGLGESVRIPRAATLYVSLSPCRMCAALLAARADDGAELRVVAAQADLGALGRQKALRRVEIHSP